VGDIDTAAVDSLKTLDPKRPIREATKQRTQFYVGFVPGTDMKPSLQYIVGDCQERGRNFDAQRFCGFQIDDECELGRLFDREVCWN
jgi:hypothetical protein